MALERGRWTFAAPLGYLNRKDQDGKPTIIHDPDRAHLVRQAFDLFATGLHSKQEVLQIVTNLGLRSKTGKKLTKQTIDEILRNPIYAGWLTVNKWGERRKGNFAPSVSDGIFEKVRALLSGSKQTLVPHQRNHPDFPSRHFVTCAHCGRPLTASWSTGRKGRKHAFYRCPNSECKAINVRKLDLENAFLDYLQGLQPKPECLRTLKEVMLNAWTQTQAQAMSQTVALERELEDVKERKEKLVEEFVYRQAIDQATYQQQFGQVERGNHDH